VLRDEVAAGRFREDLFFRLNVIPCTCCRCASGATTCCRSRAISSRATRRGRTQLAFSAETEQALLAHPWPGNVRELENAVERAVVLARGDESRPRTCCSATPACAARRRRRRGTLQHALDERHRGPHSEPRSTRPTANAPSRAGARHRRTTLYRLMKRLGLQD
jgi:DNA-binding NtrC family response regulator